MASEVVEEGSCYEWSSYIRGYHDYQAVWTPTIGEMLLLKVEPTNPYDDFAVSIVKDGAVAGHVPMSAELFASFSRGLKVSDFAK